MFEEDQLNSQHLNLDRRDAFRQARSLVRDACGEFTHMGMPQQGWVNSPEACDRVKEFECRLPPDFNHGLVEDGGVYPLKVGINTIGRMADNDVVIQDPHISRRHFAVVVHASTGFELHDVASKNGTYLNGARLNGPAALVPGDEIRVCARRLVFVARSRRQAAG